MKTKLQILALTVATLLVAGAIVYAERTRAREITIPVKGMVCEGCEKHLREKLLELPGVKSAAPSHQDEQIIVVVEGWSRPDMDQLSDVIKQSGYDPAHLEE